MAAIPITIVGIETRDDGSSGNVTIIGMASITGVGVGGGPIIPPPSQPPSGAHPEHPIWGPPGINFPDKPGYPPTVGGGPILPTPPLPPEVTQPQPGDPPVLMPPPAGSGGWPVHPMTPPPYVVVNYPGVGPIVVAPPATDATAPAPA
jgi:hypothetical protein